MTAKLLTVAEETRAWWQLPVKTTFHHVVSQVVTQMVAFSISRKIRASLYTLLGDPYDQSKFDACSDEELREQAGLQLKQIQLLRNVSDYLHRENGSEAKTNIGALTVHGDHQHLVARNSPRVVLGLSALKGIGPWTVKSCLLMLRLDDDDLFLSEDAYIRARLSELLSCSRPLTRTKAAELAKQWSPRQSTVSRFLWRVKPGGVVKLKSNIPLTRQDFL